MNCLNSIIDGIMKLPGEYNNVKNVLFIKKPNVKHHFSMIVTSRKLLDKETGNEINIGGGTISLTIMDKLRSKFLNATFRYKTFYGGILPKFIERIFNLKQERDI